MEPPIAAAFGAVLRERREAVGISQEQLADRAGLHRTYISLIERGKRTASIEVVRKVSTALGLTMTDLINATEKRRG